MPGATYNDVIDRLDLGVAHLDADCSLRHANVALKAELSRNGLSGDGATSDRPTRLLPELPGWPTGGRQVR